MSLVSSLLHDGDSLAKIASPRFLKKQYEQLLHPAGKVLLKNAVISSSDVFPFFFPAMTSSRSANMFSILMIPFSNGVLISRALRLEFRVYVT